MIATTPPTPTPTPVCSSVILSANGLVCANAPTVKPFGCKAGQIVTLTVNNKLICVRLHPCRHSPTPNGTQGARPGRVPRRSLRPPRPRPRVRSTRRCHVATFRMERARPER